MIAPNDRNAATPEGMDGATATPGASPSSTADGNYFIDNAQESAARTSGSVNGVAPSRAHIGAEDAICPCNNDAFPCSYCKADFPAVRERVLEALRNHWRDEDERARQVDLFRHAEGSEVWYLGQDDGEPRDGDEVSV